MGTFQFNTTPMNYDSIYIWGAGMVARYEESSINELKKVFPIKGFIDSNPLLFGEILFGLPIAPPHHYAMWKLLEVHLLSFLLTEKRSENRLALF